MQTQYIYKNSLRETDKKLIDLHAVCIVAWKIHIILTNGNSVQQYFNRLKFNRILRQNFQYVGAKFGLKFSCTYKIISTYSLV